MHISRISSRSNKAASGSTKPGLTRFYRLKLINTQLQLLQVPADLLKLHTMSTSIECVLVSIWGPPVMETHIRSAET